MPCYECENGKWKFGETGKCQYDSKSDCETANKDYYKDEEDVKDDFEVYFEEVIKKLINNKNPT